MSPHNLALPHRVVHTVAGIAHHCPGHCPHQRLWRRLAAAFGCISGLVLTDLTNDNGPEAHR